MTKTTPRNHTDELRLRVAAHIGAAELLDNGRMRCPACGGLDFGPTIPLHELAVYSDRYLPGAPLLRGVCLDCEHATSPRQPAPGIAISYHQPAGGKTVIHSEGDGHLPGAICPGCQQQAIYAVEAMEVRPVALAGQALKLGGQFGVQLICRNPACTLPDSPVVTRDRPRSYEPARRPPLA